MKRTVLCAMLLASAAGADQAGTHLRPPKANPAWDLSAIRKAVFAQALTGDTQAWMFEEGGMMPDSSITALRRRPGGYRIVHMKVAAVLALYTPGAAHLGPPSPRDYRALKPSRCSIGVSDALGGRLLTAWRAVLRKTRDDGVPRQGLDAERDEFFVRDGARELRGIIRSAERDTEPGMLASIAGRMAALCTTGSRRRVADIESGLSRLEHHLREEKQE